MTGDRNRTGLSGMVKLAVAAPRARQSPPVRFDLMASLTFIRNHFVSIFVSNARTPGGNGREGRRAKSLILFPLPLTNRPPVHIRQSDADRTSRIVLTIHMQKCARIGNH